MLLDSFLKSISELKAKAEVCLGAVNTLDELAQFQTDFLSKKSELQALLKGIKNFSPEEKQQIGPQIQALKVGLQQGFEVKVARLEKEALDIRLKKEFLDVTVQTPFEKGALHPISKIQQKIESVFSSMGFEIVDGPEVETEWHNFEALNIPDTHPARDMQDTFFVSRQSKDAKENTVLRTHGTCVDIRRMLEKGVPIRAIAPARVFRNEDVDATHDAMFYQVDGILVDKNISLSHLKAVTETMLSAVFERPIKVRIRPGYFPFVEPGLEVDIWWEYEDKKGNKKAKWLEFMGAGMLHPNVLKNCGVDPKEYSGFAFGFGLTRLVMMKYGIDDIRLLTSKKTEFLSQF